MSPLSTTGNNVLPLAFIRCSLYCTVTLACGDDRAFKDVEQFETGSYLGEFLLSVERRQCNAGTVSFSLLLLLCLKIQ